MMICPGGNRTKSRQECEREKMTEEFTLWQFRKTWVKCGFKLPL